MPTFGGGHFKTMKIILVHNKYQQAGGEDLVFHSEGEMLQHHGHDVKYVIFDNKDIKTTIDKWLSGIKVIYNTGSYRRLHRVIAEFKPDIIHIHNFVPLASPSILFAAKRHNVPVVVTLHNYRLICPSATLFYKDSIYEKSVHTTFPWDAIKKGIYRNSRLQTAALVISTRFHNVIGTWRDKVDKFIVLTEFARRKFADSVLKAAPEAFEVKPNFVVDHGVGKPIRENFYLYVGRLTEEKGLTTLLESAKRYQYKLVIIGDGPLRDAVMSFVQSNTNLSYLGYKPKEVIMEYMKKCKALIFPSTWYEGFPMTILEAFSAGTPVIASRLGSMAEIVQDNVNGLHFTAGDAVDLMEKLKIADAQPGLMEKLARNARENYLKHYTAEINYKLLFDIYHQVLKQDLKAI
jgi:glycosyltransferase involved in cell wall biosynthesis